MQLKERRTIKGILCTYMHYNSNRSLLSKMTVSQHTPLQSIRLAGMNQSVATTKSIWTAGIVSNDEDNASGINSCDKRYNGRAIYAATVYLCTSYQFRDSVGSRRIKRTAPLEDNQG